MGAEAFHTTVPESHLPPQIPGGTPLLPEAPLVVSEDRIARAAVFQQLLDFSKTGRRSFPVGERSEELEVVFSHLYSIAPQKSGELYAWIRQVYLGKDARLGQEQNGKRGDETSAILMVHITNRSPFSYEVVPWHLKIRFLTEHALMGALPHYSWLYKSEEEINASEPDYIDEGKWKRQERAREILKNAANLAAIEQEIALVQRRAA